MTVPEHGACLHATGIVSDARPCVGAQVDPRGLPGLGELGQRECVRQVQELYGDERVRARAAFFGTGHAPPLG